MKHSENEAPAKRLVQNDKNSRIWPRIVSACSRRRLPHAIKYDGFESVNE